MASANWRERERDATGWIYLSHHPTVMLKFGSAVSLQMPQVSTVWSHTEIQTIAGLLQELCSFFWKGPVKTATNRRLCSMAGLLLQHFLGPAWFEDILWNSAWILPSNYRKQTRLRRVWTNATLIALEERSFQRNVRYLKEPCFIKKGTWYSTPK